MLPVFVPPPSLMGRAGGSEVPNLRRVTPVGSVPPCTCVPPADAPSAVVPVGGASLPLGGIFVDGACGSPCLVSHGVDVFLCILFLRVDDRATDVLVLPDLHDLFGLPQVLGLMV